jgi:hypothetical protein
MRSIPSSYRRAAGLLAIAIVAVGLPWVITGFQSL